MILTHTFSNSLFKTFFLVGIIALSTCKTFGQKRFYSQRSKNYYGFTMSFGNKLSALGSDIRQLDGLNLTNEGGSIGLTAGNNRVMLRADLAGFYYSGGNMKHTVDLFQSGLLLNLYPLNFRQKPSKSRSRIHPYITSGIQYNTLKFYGHYVEESAQKARNYSMSEAPYLGKMNVSNAVLGIGLEYRLPGYKFVHLFMDGQFSKPLARVADSDFQNTSYGNALAVNVGVSFGAKR